MARRILLAGVASLFGLMAGGAGQAGTISAQWDGTGLFGPYDLGSSTNGFLTNFGGPGPSAAFLLTAIATNFQLATNVTFVTSNFFGVNSITVWVTETGLSFPSGYSWQAQTGLTGQLLPPNTSLTISSYVDPSDTPYAETVLTDSLTCSITGAVCDNFPGKTIDLAGSGPFSITQKYVMTVSGDPGAAPIMTPTINTNLTGTAVPEASTWTMMLAGFAGLGYFAARQGRKKAEAIA